MRLTLFFAAFFISLQGFSQLQIRLSGEYGVGLQKDFIQNTNELGRVSNQRGSYGNGIFVNFSAGKGFTSNTSVLVDLTYLSSVNYQQTSCSSDGRTQFFTVSQGNYFAVTPNLMIKSSGTGIQPYLRVGPILAFSKVTEDRSYTDDPDGKDIFVYKGGLALGVLGVLGVEFFTGDGAVFFIEAVSRNITYHPRKLVNTESFRGEATDQDRFFRNNPSESTHLLAVSKTFSSLGGSIGIKLNINSKKPIVKY